MMLALDPDIQAQVLSDEIAGAFWLVKLELEGGTQYFSERQLITWDGHVWSPLLDPEGPIDNLEQCLQIDEKNDIGFNLVNVNGGISALLATNDFENRRCTIYLYFPAVNKAQPLFYGFAKKPESMNDLVISVPVVSFLHGPRVRLPGRVFACACGFTFTDGFDCPYNPAGGIGVVDPATGLPFTWCPKSKKGCIARGMFDPGNHEHPGYYGGFDKWSLQATGKDNSTGFCRMGRDQYTSDGVIQDNLFTDAVPLIYGKIRLLAIPYFWVDESEFLLVGGFLGEGQLQIEYPGSPHNFTKQYLCNGKSTHDFKYPPFDCPGYPGQYVPDFGNRPSGLPYYDADPFCSTAYIIMRIKDEVGIQSNKQVELSARIMGRMVRVYWFETGIWHYATSYSETPHDVVMDLMCNPRGGLGRSYEAWDLPLLSTERSYSEQQILDWDGRTRKRFAFAGAILDQQPACDLLERIRDEFSLWFRDNGDQIAMGFIKPNQTSVFTFSEEAGTLIVGDEGESLVEISEKSAEDVPNKLVVSFLDDSNNWEKTTFFLENRAGIERAGKVISEEKFLGFTTNLGQAMRIASNFMERTISGNWYASWKAPIKALAVEVGDVVTLDSSHLPSGQDTFLITKKVITHDFDIEFEGRLYRSEFYDDVVADEYDDLLRTSPDNPLRPPAEVENLAAVENIVQVDGVNTSEIVVSWTYPNPPDELCKEIEVWWRDTLSPDQSWSRAAVAASAETSAKFALPIRGYRMLELRARAVSRYGIMRDLDNEDVPQTALLVDGTLDDNVPDPVQNLTVKTSGTDATVPTGFFRVGFDAGAANWNGVHTIYIEANETLPFSDGSIIPSGGIPVSGNGVIQAGGNSIFCEGKTWTPDDSMLLGALAIVTDGSGNVQARLTSGNTADTVYTSGPWYLPDGTYAFEVRTDFTKANYRGFMFEAIRGAFSPADRSFQFDLPLTNTSLYFRVAAFNAFGKSSWVVSGEVTNTSVDRIPAALLAAFNITSQGYAADDGSQKSIGTIEDCEPPDPLGNFSHIVLFADVPVPGKVEKERVRIGEFWDAGEVFVMEPTDAAVTFYAVSANLSGWYPENWEEIGEGILGGYRKIDVVMSPDNTIPPIPAALTATYAALGGTIDVVWTTVAVPDLADYQVVMRKAATEAELATLPYGTELNARTLSTIFQYPVKAEDSGKYFQFAVQGIDNLGNQGGWKESNVVRAYAGASVQPVAVPLNLGVTGVWEYRMGVPISFISVNWDNPSDPNFGGVQVWVVDLTRPSGILYDIVEGTPGSPSSSTLTLLMDAHVLKVRLVPFNRSGVVPDFGTYVDSPSWTNSPATFGESVPAPDITARDGVGCVHLQVEVPAWAGMSNPYSSLLLFISKQDNSGYAVYVGRWPTTNASGTPERMFVDIPFQALTDVAGGPWSTGVQYYFYGKLETISGAQSAFSVDTDYSAIFIDGGLTEDGVPDFGAGVEVMRVAASDRFLFVGWNAPTANGATVYLSQLQVARDSGFASLIEDYSVNAKSGSKGVGLPENGTYYLRVRYRNNSATGWSEWFGLKEGTASATVKTEADQTGDTGYIDGATKLAATYTTLEQQDALRIAFKMGSTAPNCATWYNLTALWSDTQSKLDDANYVLSSPTLSWLDNDSWISTGATVPATSWIGKVLQYRYNASPALYISGVITQIDAVNNKVQLNVSWGAAKSSQTGRVVTPYWERTGVFWKEVGEDTDWHLERNVDYYLPQINQYASGTTVYFRLIPVNIFGPGTAYAFSLSVGSTAGIVVSKGQGYANDYAPTGTFGSGGYQWTAAANGTVDFNKTFAYTQAADANYRADSFVVLVRSGGGTPDPATDPKLVFPVNHASGSQNYSLKIPNLDPFTTYSFRVYGAKNGVSGMILGTGSTLTDSNLIYTTGDDLILKPNGTTGMVKVLLASGGADGLLQAGKFILRDGNGDSYRVRITKGLTGITVVSDYVASTFSVESTSTAVTLSTRAGTNVCDLELLPGSGKLVKLRSNSEVTGTLSASAGLGIGTAGYQYPLKMGGYYLWVNATSGKLYIKSGAPTSDTNGTIVGTQS